MIGEWNPRDLLEVVPLRSRGWLRWTARLVGLAVAVFVLVMVIGDAIAESSEGISAIGVGVGILFGWVFLSMVAAWRWEKLGGLSCILVAVALGIFVAVTAGRNNALAALAMGLPIIAIGMAFLVAARGVPPRRTAA